MTRRVILALDTMLDDVEVETSVAQQHGWTFARWDGSAERLADAHAVVHVRTTVDKQLIGRLTSCAAIGRFGTGLDTVDIDSATEAQIAVVNVRDYCIPEMTMHTLALALSLVQRIGPQHDNEADQRVGWQRYREVNRRRGGFTAHVIGYGSVGASVARTTRSLGMRTLVTSRRSQAELATGLTAVGIEDGLTQADVIFLHRELSAQTVGFFGDDLLCRVRPGTLLVNTARKELMDAAAVRRALEQGKLGGLGLDALLEEGNPLAQLLGRADVLVTPHVSWYSERSLEEIRRRTIADTISAYGKNAVHRSITPGEIHDIR